MTLSQEMFRFVTMRRPERALLSRLASRLMLDRRQTTRNSLLYRLFGPGLFESKLVTANNFAASADFLDANDPVMRALEPAVQFFRDELERGVALADLAATFRVRAPLLAALLEHAPPPQLLEATRALTARLWDSLYAQTIRGCDRYVSTNYLVDGLRVYHVLRLLWLSVKLNLSHWAGGDFDDYDALIDLAAAFALNDGGDQTPTVEHTPNLQEFNQLQHLTELLEELDQAHAQVGSLIAAGAVRNEPEADSGSGSGTAGGYGGNGATVTFFDAEATRVLSKVAVLAKIDLAVTPVEQVQRQLRLSREVAAVQRQHIFDVLIDPNAMHESQALASQALALRGNSKVPAAALTSLGATGGVFRVPLAVGEMKPPLVGDLLLVEQELRGYETGELADIEPIMKGERRERTIRKLNRTSSTTSTETLQETEESQSTRTDERFQLSSEAQQTAEQSFGLEAGVNVSGKFGPVQVGASVNASFNTSKSSSESTSQDFAKSVTEEASKKVKNSIKETSSITVLTEDQDTTLKGLNNEKGAAHINGMYRWVDKIYEARLMNYGRRLMLSLAVPEPAAFYRALLQQNEAAALADLVLPLHPSRIDRSTLRPLDPDDTTHGFQSSKDVNDSNYARLAALYDVTVTPPPVLGITGSKAIVYPDLAQPTEIKGGDTSWVFSDNSLTVDSSYRLDAVGVFVSEGALGLFGNYVDILELGEDAAKIEDANVLLVQVADKSFYLTAYKDPDDKDNKVVNSNFNKFQSIQRGYAFGEGLAGTVPITINAYFQGMLSLTVIYRAVRTDEAYDAWKASTYATILKGYNVKKSAYDQALAAAEAKADTGTTAQTFALRDDQYRSIELTELKRGCIDLLTAGTAAGYTSIAVAADGTPDIVYDSAEGALLGNWRSPLANGAVAEMFETAFEWDDTTYSFYPYYWAGSERWKDLAQASGSDPVFEQFLRAGSANVLVPVRTGFERPVILFLKTGLIWGGGYLPLFNVDDMLDVYADVELGRQFDPPLQIGDPWEIRLPTSMVMLQESDELPQFPEEEAALPPPSTEEPTLDATVPF